MLVVHIHAYHELEVDQQQGMKIPFMDEIRFHIMIWIREEGAADSHGRWHPAAS